MTWTVTWTDDKVALTEKLWLDGFSYRQIAAELGITRNAVGGFINRRDWKREPQTIKQKVERPREGKPITFKHVIAKITRPRPKDFDLPPDQSTFAVTFDDLQYRHCRFPLGASPFMFCGADKIEGSSYCGRHHRLCYYRHTRVSGEEGQLIRERNMRNYRLRRVA